MINAAAESRSSPRSSSSGTPLKSSRCSSPSRSANSIAMRSASRRRATNNRAPADDASSHCESSITHSTGRCSASSDNNVRHPTAIKNRSSPRAQPARALPEAPPPVAPGGPRERQRGAGSAGEALRTAAPTPTRRHGRRGPACPTRSPAPPATARSCPRPPRHGSPVPAARDPCSVQQCAQLGTLRITPIQHDMILCTIAITGHLSPRRLRPPSPGAAPVHEQAAHIHANEIVGLDDEEERGMRLLLLGKRAVLADQVRAPLAAEMDERRQRVNAGRRVRPSAVPLRDRRILAVMATGSSESPLGGVGEGQALAGSVGELGGDGVEVGPVTGAKSVPLGNYWRSRPFVFSLEPRCHGVCGHRSTPPRRCRCGTCFQSPFPCPGPGQGAPQLLGERRDFGGKRGRDVLRLEAFG